MAILEYTCTSCGRCEDFFSDEMVERKDTQDFESRVSCKCGENSWIKNDQTAHVWVGRRYYSNPVTFPDSFETRDAISQKAGAQAIKESARVSTDIKMNLGRPLEGKEDEAECWVG